MPERGEHSTEDDKELARAIEEAARRGSLDIAAITALLKDGVVYARLEQTILDLIGQLDTLKRAASHEQKSTQFYWSLVFLHIRIQAWNVRAVTESRVRTEDAVGSTQLSQPELTGVSGVAPDDLAEIQVPERESAKIKLRAELKMQQEWISRTRTLIEKTLALSGAGSARSVKTPGLSGRDAAELEFIVRAREPVDEYSGFLSDFASGLGQKDVMESIPATSLVSDLQSAQRHFGALRQLIDAPRIGRFMVRLRHLSEERIAEEERRLSIPVDENRVRIIEDQIRAQTDFFFHAERCTRKAREALRVSGGIELKGENSALRTRIVARLEQYEAEIGDQRFRVGSWGERKINNKNVVSRGLSEAWNVINTLYLVLRAINLDELIKFTEQLPGIITPQKRASAAHLATATPAEVAAARGREEAERNDPDLALRSQLLERRREIYCRLGYNVMAEENFFNRYGVLQAALKRGVGVETRDYSAELHEINNNLRVLQQKRPDLFP